MSLVLRVTRNPKISAMKYNKNKSVSVRQMVLMVNFLEGHRSLACGNLRKNRKKNLISLRLWAKCAKILNADPEGDPRSPIEWKRWFLQYKSRLLTRIRRSEVQQDTDEDAESAPPLTALEAQFAAVCGADTVTAGSHIHQKVATDPLGHTNGSVSSVSKESSSYDEQESYRDSDSEREELPTITSHKASLTNNPNRPIISNNRLEVFGKIVGLKLLEVQENQRAIAEKIIKDAIFMAEQGILTMDHAFNFANAHNNNSNKNKL